MLIVQGNHGEFLPFKGGGGRTTTGPQSLLFWLSLFLCLLLILFFVAKIIAVRGGNLQIQKSWRGVGGEEVAKRIGAGAAEGEKRCQDPF